MFKTLTRLMLKNTFIVGTIVEAKVFKKAKKPAN
jgi:hypothetical protein